MNLVFEYIGQKPKRMWNGNHFFGLHRKDVQMELKSVNTTSDVTPVSAPIANDTPVTKGAINEDTFEQLLHRKNSSTSWLGVISIGEVKKSHFRQVGSQMIFLPIGYVAARTISVPSASNIDDDKSVITIHCKISELNGNINFSCTESMSDRLLGSSLNPSEAVRQTLKKLKVTATRRWSGLDFFGLTRKDVINFVNSKSRNEECPQKDLHSPPNKLMKELMNVRHRNAGPTHSLLSEKSRMQRNDLIHRLVNFASFGDVEGRYHFF